MLEEDELVSPVRVPSVVAQVHTILLSFYDNNCPPAHKAYQLNRQSDNHYYHNSIHFFPAHHINHHAYNPQHYHSTIIKEDKGRKETIDPRHDSLSAARSAGEFVPPCLFNPTKYQSFINSHPLYTFHKSFPSYVLLHTSVYFSLSHVVSSWKPLSILFFFSTLVLCLSLYSNSCCLCRQ